MSLLRMAHLLFVSALVLTFSSGCTSRDRSRDGDGGTYDAATGRSGDGRGTTPSADAGVRIADSGTRVESGELPGFASVGIGSVDCVAYCRNLFRECAGELTFEVGDHYGYLSASECAERCGSADESWAAVDAVGCGTAWLDYEACVAAVRDVTCYRVGEEDCGIEWGVYAGCIASAE